MSLQNRNIFDKLSMEMRTAIFAVSKEIQLEKGAVLFEENDNVENLYIVLDGYMSLYRNSRYGDIKIIFVCTGGECLNESILEDGRTAIASKALSDAKLLCVPKEKLFDLARLDNAFALALFASLSYKTRRLYHQTGNANRTYPLENKLAAKIWKLARDYGSDTKSGRKINFEITVVMLANMLGAKRETVSREISALKKEGLILQENGYFIVTDMLRLRTIM